MKPRSREPTVRRPAGPRHVPAGPRLEVPRLWSAGFALAMLGLYLGLTPGVSGDKDASELTLVLATCGVIHPTGYPIYTLLGHGFVLLLHALGLGWPLAANLWACAGGGVAIFLYHRLALRILPIEAVRARGARFALAGLPALILGLNPVWTAECTGVEVHSWHLAWVCGLCLLFAGILESLDATDRDIPPLGRRMLAWGFWCGVGGAHHPASVFFAAGLTAVLARALWRTRRFDRKVPLAWLVAGALPLLSYAYLYWRAAHPGGAVIWPNLEPSLRSTLDHVAASAYQQYLGHWSPEASEQATLHRQVYPFLWPGLLVLAVLGFGAPTFVGLWMTRGLVISALAQLVFVYRYGALDPTAYFLPCLAVALLSLVPLSASVQRRLRRLTETAIASLAVAVGLGLLAVPWIRAARGRRDGYVQVNDLLHRMWLSIPFEKGIVLWPNGNYYALQEFQRFQGEKPDVDAFATVMLCNPAPRAAFQKKYGFDPLARNDAAHLAAPLQREYVIGQPRSEAEARFFALIHETIANRASVPVAGFDAPHAVKVLRKRRAP